ncbi:MAG: lytic murein transglycosylase [Parcubacteria group bacterium]|nr:lytic murein transglycosylase [Parcubacteria group bacterium]
MSAFVLCVFSVFLMSVIVHARENDSRQERLRDELIRITAASPGYIQRIFSHERLGVRRAERTPECETVQGPKGEEDEWLLEHPEYLLLGKKSLELGAVYYRTHEEAFGTAFLRYGVPPEYILGILRIESYFEKCVGENFILPQLMHLYAVRTGKPAFARNELAALLKLAQKYNWDADTLYAIRGSAMGAFGIAQFLPTSHVAYGKDGNGDGIVDLFDPRDAIPSIAHFLVKNKWGSDRRLSLWNYNHAVWYVNAVMKYADAIRPLLQ